MEGKPPSFTQALFCSSMTAFEKAIIISNKVLRINLTSYFLKKQQSTSATTVFYLFGPVPLPFIAVQPLGTRFP
jgi:hypothetical protein